MFFKNGMCLNIQIYRCVLCACGYVHIGLRDPSIHIQIWCRKNIIELLTKFLNYNVPLSAQPGPDQQNSSFNIKCIYLECVCVKHKAFPLTSTSYNQHFSNQEFLKQLSTNLWKKLWFRTFHASWFLVPKLAQGIDDRKKPNAFFFRHKSYF